MKLKCTLCSGKLQIGAGGQAACSVCGLSYSLERLREMLDDVPSAQELLALFTPESYTSPTTSYEPCNAFLQEEQT